MKTKSSKPNPFHRAISFLKKHPILTNLLAICLTACVLCLAAMLFLNIFTQHGKYYLVPDVKRMPISDATRTLEAAGFKWEITDSLHNEEFPLGTVVEQSPRALSEAKSARTVYLSVNSSTPRTTALPQVIDMSLRQGESILHSYGFRDVTIAYEHSPYKDLILDMTVDGRHTQSGTRLPLTAKITLTVGDGVEEKLTDSIDALTIDEDPYLSDF